MLAVLLLVFAIVPIAALLLNGVSVLLLWVRDERGPAARLAALVALQVVVPFLGFGSLVIGFPPAIGVALLVALVLGAAVITFARGSLRPAALAVYGLGLVGLIAFVGLCALLYAARADAPFGMGPSEADMVAVLLGGQGLFALWAWGAYAPAALTALTLFVDRGAQREADR